MKREHVAMRRRPLLTPVWMAAVAGVGTVVALAMLAWWWGGVDVTTVIVLRHAEKEIGTIEDSPLSTVGEERAALLARMFGDSRSPGRIDAIYATALRRSQMTAAPLASRLGIAVTTLGAETPVEIAHRALREHRGGRVIIIGHSNTVPDIVRTLSGGAIIPPIKDQEYGTIYIVTVPRVGRGNLLKLSF
jgi:2,3-bisphosphoglycerate-dependent phosphoglycerate mutase